MCEYMPANLPFGGYVMYFDTWVFYLVTHLRKISIGSSFPKMPPRLTNRFALHHLCVPKSFPNVRRTIEPLTGTRMLPNIFGAWTKRFQTSNPPFTRFP